MNFALLEPEVIRIYSAEGRGGFVAAVSFLSSVSNGDWSGRDLSAGLVAEDLNAPEAHKPPLRVALPASGGLRLQLGLVKPFPALARLQEFFSFPG